MNMTKDQEIAILTKAAADLGADSYLGLWLSSIIDELERDLRSDFVPVLTLAEARKRAADIQKEARDKASALVGDALRDADKVITEAHERRQCILSSAKQALKAAADKL
jgi:cell division septum initiation protein DivIVA